MAFIESESGRIINLDHIVSMVPQAGGHWLVRWQGGFTENFTSTDGKAVKEAVIKPKPARKPKHTVE